MPKSYRHGPVSTEKPQHHVRHRNHHCSTFTVWYQKFWQSASTFSTIGFGEREISWARLWKGHVIIDKMHDFVPLGSGRNEPDICSSSFTILRALCMDSSGVRGQKVLGETGLDLNELDMSFKNSSHTVITGESTLNHVHGHQVNGTINAEIVNFNAGQAVVKRTEYDEFEYIKRGHFTSVVDLGSIDLGGWDWKWRHGELIGRHKTQKTICTIEIIDRKSKFTAMFYEGKDAHRFWEDDFRQFSQIDKFGSSMDDIVMACARCKEKIAYLDDLFPVTTDHETEDPDHPIWVSPTQPYIRHLWRNPPRHLPMNVVGGLRFDTIYSPSLEAVAKRPRGTGSLSWWENYVGRGFVDQTALDGGLMRQREISTHDLILQIGSYHRDSKFKIWLLATHTSCRNWNDRPKRRASYTGNLKGHALVAQRTSGTWIRDTLVRFKVLSANLKPEETVT
ncbi:hypothetical protein WG66_008062 [Moniliophthora roreri]|nr:hypothetical protein WG66_008062 [Moniliophthora roreri]